MSQANKDVVRRINKCFETGDDEALLACLHPDIVWEVPPHFTTRGKDEYRAQIHGPNADGPPVIELRSMIAEGDRVTVEGYVENKFVGGGVFKARFHNAYRLKDGLIIEMTSYVVPV
jgi:uncharacterized protein